MQMSRVSRKLSSTGIYHVLIRGINQQRIFEDDEDCLRFLDDLRAAKDRSGACVLAYCLMGNHVHLVVGQGDETLGQTMKRLSVRYVAWFNMKYARVGHLFQDRFKSEAIETDPYLITVLHYLYQNPVKAGLCKRSQDYRWSSRRLLGRADDLINTDRLAKLCDIEDLLRTEEEDADAHVLEAGEDPRHGKTDAEVMRDMRSVSGADTVSEFLRLDKGQQSLAVRAMLKKGASIRQAARITGLSKGLVESWSRHEKNVRMNSG
jgi:REP element-mobilizing transposase RayT